jgi:hypothetical protein
MSEQEQQKKVRRPSPCKICKDDKHKIEEPQMIFFHKLDDETYHRTDAKLIDQEPYETDDGEIKTRNVYEDTGKTHRHRKMCNNNCGTMIFYDEKEGFFVEVKSGERHDCPNYESEGAVAARETKGQDKQEQPQQTKLTTATATNKSTISLEEIKEIEKRVRSNIDESTNKLFIEIKDLIKEIHQQQGLTNNAIKTLGEHHNEVAKAFNKLMDDLKPFLPELIGDVKTTKAEFVEDKTDQGPDDQEQDKEPVSNE